MSEKKNEEDTCNPETLLTLGAWLGRHQAFGMIANRYSAADAECLKTIRDGGEYKQLGLTWEQFCTKHAGVSRVHADRQIHYFEEFGPNYHRFAEVMPISPATYRLIGASVSDEGIESDGVRIPLVRENRDKIAAAVTAIRAKAAGKTAPVTTIAEVRKRWDALLAEVSGVSNEANLRLDLICLLQDGSEYLQGLATALREKTLVVK